VLLQGRCVNGKDSVPIELAAEGPLAPSGQLWGILVVFPPAVGTQETSVDGSSLDIIDLAVGRQCADSRVTP